MKISRAERFHREREGCCCSENRQERNTLTARWSRLDWTTGRLRAITRRILTPVPNRTGAPRATRSAHLRPQPVSKLPRLFARSDTSCDTGSKPFRTPTTALRDHARTDPWCTDLIISPVVGDRGGN
ncbi:uncharacterized protein LOC144474072 [Augochlora pura]